MKRILLLCALALLAYSNSFRSGFVFDNSWVILNDARLQSPSAENLHLILTEDYGFRNTTSGLYRPLTTLTYLLNYAVLGNGANPAGYHWVNLVLHLVNMLLVYFLGLRLFRSNLAALAMAALWGLHPVLTESVTNLVGRADVLSALGVLAGLHCHIEAAESAGRRRLWWLAGLAASATVAIFSKESGIVLAGVLVLWDVAFAGRKLRWLQYAVLAPPVLLFFAMRASALAKGAAMAVPFTDNPIAGAGFWEGRVLAVEVIGRYLWLLVWPQWLSCDYSYNQVPLVMWQAIAAVVVCAGLAAIAVMSYGKSGADPLVRGRPPGRPLAEPKTLAGTKSGAGGPRADQGVRPTFFLIAFFFVTLAPVSNLALTIGTILGERLLYLPSVAFAGALAWAVAAYPKRAAIAAGVLCLAYAGRTYARNADWLDDQTLWSSAARAAPNSYKTRIHFASALVGPKGENIVQAVREVDTALAILDPLPDDRNTPQPYSVGGFLYRIQGDLAGAQGRAWYEKSLVTLQRGERIDRASAARLGSAAPAGWYALYLELGDTWLRLGDPRRAIQAFEYGRAIRPAPEFFEDLAGAYRTMGDPQRATTALVEGLLINERNPRLSALLRASGPPDLCAAARNVSALYRQMGQGSAAAAMEQRAATEFHCR